MSNQSYIRILQAIEFFSSEHLQIQRFASDFPSQLPNFGTIDDAYPVLFVSPTNTIFDEHATTFNLDIYCFDIIQKDRSNINTILSDTNLILNDLKKWLMDGDLFGIDVIDAATAVPINNGLLDYAAGWVMSITIDADTYSVCEIPFNNLPVVSGITSDVRYERFLTCESLTDCTVIQDIFLDISDRTLWRGNWVQGVYVKNEQVLDGSFLAIANKTTEDRPAPQPIGAPDFVYSGDISSTSVSAKQVIFGNRYEFNENIFLEGWRVNVVAGNNYSVYLVEDPTGLPIITQIIHFTAQNSGWIPLNLSKTIITSGSTYDLVVTVSEPDPTPTTFSGDWNYLKPNNATVPNAGEITHANKLLTTLRVHKIDNDSNDRTSELSGLSIGDIIEVNTTRWAIQSVTDDGLYFSFGISPATQLTSTGIKNFVFETVSSTPITYPLDSAFWTNNPPLNISAQGLLGIDTPYTSIVPDGTAYGVDILVREILPSPDWDLQAFTSVVSSNGSAGGSITINGVTQDLSEDREWLTAQASTGILNYGTGITANTLTSIRISAMDGYIVNNETNPAIPTHTYVSYSGSSNVPVTTIGSGIASYVLLDNTGQPYFQNTFPTSAERKANIWIGKIAHPNASITAVINEPDFITSPLSQFRDLFQALIYINKGVYPYPNGTNMNLNITLGTIIGDGINLHNSNTVPNEIQMGPEVPATFFYRTQTGGTFPATTFISGNTYDASGSTASVPATASTIQWIFCIPDTGFVVQFGQTLYPSLNEAITNIGREQFTVFPSLVENAILIGLLALTSTATTLNDTSQAQFFRADKFGQIVSSQVGVATSTSTLQDIYNNSTQAQITIGATGALQIKGTGDGTDAILQGLDSVNNVNFNISSDGCLTANCTTFNSISAVTYENMPFWEAGGGTNSVKQKRTAQPTIANGNNSLAFGSNAQAYGLNSIAIGLNSLAKNEKNICIGYNTRFGVAGDNSIAIGNGAGGGDFCDGSIAIGLNTGTPDGTPNAISIGRNVLSNAANSLMLGHDMTLFGGDRALMVGYNSFVGSNTFGGAGNSILLGNDSLIDGASDFSFIAGYTNNLYDNSPNSVLIGSNSTIGAASPNSVIIGSTSTIDSGLANVIILGNGITGAFSDTTYVNNLLLNTYPVNPSIAYLGIDANGYIVQAPTPTGGGGTGATVWTSGSTGSFNIKAINDSTTDATGDYSVAEGFNTLASGISGAHAEGSDTIALGNASHAEGAVTQANGLASHSEGFFSIAQGDYSHAEGNDTDANGQGSHSEGQFTTAAGVASHAEGNTTNAVGDYSHAEGQNTHANGNYSHAEGDNSTAVGLDSHAEGFNTQAQGDDSHAEGQTTVAVGIACHAEGIGTTADGLGSHAEGNGTAALFNYSHAEGSGTQALNLYAHAEGLTTIANGIDSHAEGRDTIANGGHSHAEGRGSVTYGSAAHAEGSFTVATGTSAHAEGANTTANGEFSHAGGQLTFANGQASFVHGTSSTAAGLNTVVLGANINGLSANTTYVDKFNITTTTGGTSTSHLGIDANGFVVRATDVFVTGGTFISDTLTLRNNSGGTFNVTGFVTGQGTFFTGGTVSGPTNFTNGLTSTTINSPSISASSITTDTFKLSGGNNAQYVLASGGSRDYFSAFEGNSRQLSGTTALQKLFTIGTTGSGSFPVKATTVYEFTWVLVITNMSAVSAAFNMGFLGTGAGIGVRMITNGVKQTTISTPVAGLINFGGNGSYGSSFLVTAAGTGTAVKVEAKGTIVTVGSGTVIPAVALGNAGGTNSIEYAHFVITEMGPTTGSTSAQSSVGNWS